MSENGKQIHNCLTTAKDGKRDLEPLTLTLATNLHLQMERLCLAGQSMYALRDYLEPLHWLLDARDQEHQENTDHSLHQKILI